VPLISYVGPPLNTPLVESLSAHYTRNRCSEVARPAHSFYYNVAVFSMDPVSELVRLYSGSICLRIYAPEKKTLGAHEIIVWLHETVRVAHDVRSHLELQYERAKCLILLLVNLVPLGERY